MSAGAPSALSKPQRDLLQRLADAAYGELCIHGSADHRVYDSLHRKGLVEMKSGGWGKIEPQGREALR